MRGFLSVKTGALNLVLTFQNPATFKALLCLAGDFKQLGPVIHSPVAIEYGLQIALMERIVGKITVDHSRVFTLLDTYRSHPSILKLYNKLIYADVLKCCCPASSYNMESWSACPVDSAGTKHPVIFHHCNGQESRQKDSPSWQNIDEIKIVKDYLGKLKTLGIPADEIGIISPYHKQCQALRIMCKGLQFHVEVGTTELFQGREKRVILMSLFGPDRSGGVIWTDAVSVFLLGRVKVPLLKSEYWEYMFWQSTFVPLKIASFLVFFSIRSTQRLLTGLLEEVSLG